FAFTVDATGLQTFPQMYRMGVPLGTQSQWGWHSFGNPKNYTHNETLKNYDFGHGKTEPYSVQFNEAGRPKEAANWFRVNPHRLHLGIVGLELTKGITATDFKNMKQELNLWNGNIVSNFTLNNQPVKVQTTCHPVKDMIAARITSKLKAGVNFRFPYPSGGHCDDGCDWKKTNLHTTVIVNQDAQSALLERKIDATTYYVNIQWKGNAKLSEKEKNYFVLTPQTDDFSFTCQFTSDKPKAAQPEFSETLKTSSDYWINFWKEGGAVDFSACKDARAPELERRVVLSQYLLAIQCAGSTPPQETGLTYNSWFGKFHLEMIWWHEAQFALWGRAHLLDRTLGWYEKAYPIAKEIA
ncbi:MAG: hypothetical protein RR220_09845, partial [Bacteroidaceae bacterium]